MLLCRGALLHGVCMHRVLLRGRGLQQGPSPLREGWEVVPW